MKAPRALRTCLLMCTLASVLRPLQGFGQQAATSPSAGPQQTAAVRDGQHDFDFSIGTWKSHIRRLVHPLTGSTTWVELNGTAVIRKVWDGRANLVELEVDSPSGHIEALSLHLYNAEAHQWNLNFVNRADGTLGQPAIGEFKNGRGEIFDQELFNGRSILVRAVLKDITPNSYQIEQAFSDDGGKTWEVNWIDTRVKGATDAAP